MIHSVKDFVDKKMNKKSRTFSQANLNCVTLLQTLLNVFINYNLLK